jgi:tensin
VHWGFPDHHAPPLFLLMRICRSMYDWLSAAPGNVCVVHCLAGKGRTGLVVAAFFIYVGLFASAQSALAFFAFRRSQNNWGCTNPSQVQSVRCFADIISGKCMPTGNAKVLHRVTMSPLPDLEFYGHMPGLQVLVSGARTSCIYDSIAAMGGQMLPLTSQQRTWNLDHLNVTLRGDVTFVFLKEASKGGLKSFCYVSFNVGVLDAGDQVVRLKKTDVDDAFKDSRFPNDFRVELFLVDAPPEVTDCGKRFQPFRNVWHPPAVCCVCGVSPVSLSLVLASGRTSAGSC